MLWRRWDRELEEELAFHLEMRARELEAAGEAPARARERALERFGSVSEVRRRCGAIARRRERKMARAEYVEELVQDVRFSFRTLTRSPVFTLMALTTLVLGIGANSAIFSVVNGVLLRPLPFPAPEEFVHLGWVWGGDGAAQGAVTAYKLEWFGERAASFEAVSTFRTFSSGVGGGAAERPVRGLRVTRGFLAVTGYPLAAGRWFSAEEDEPGGPAVAVLGHGLWRTAFDGDPGVLGREILVGGEPRTVIGVLSPAFRFPHAPEHIELLVPMRLRADPQDQGHNYLAIARLADGVDRDRAAAELTGLSSRFRAEHPELMGEAERGMGLTSYREIYVGSLGGVLWILLGAVGLVLLIACANVANLLLARTAERQREMAVRSAIGASRGRLVRQLLTESLTLSLVAGVLALVLGAWATRALVAAAPMQLPRAGEIGLDGSVVVFTLGAAVLTAVMFGLAAALPSSLRPVQGLRAAGGSSAPGGRLRAALVTSEAAVSLVLLVGAGLLISTLVELRRVDPGFEPDGLIAASVPRWPDRYQDPATLAALERGLLERLGPSGTAAGATPVRGFALATNLPLRRGWNLPMEVEGRPEARAGDVEWRAVSPGYFETVGTSVVRGRGFTAADDASGPRVVVVNEAFVRAHFQDADPIGQRIGIGRYQGEWIGPEFAGEPAEIVGVVADMREMSLRTSAKQTMLVPRPQAAVVFPPVILLRTARPGAAAAALAQALRDLDPALPPPTLVPMREVIGESLARERFNALVMGVFSGLALVLTAVGIFGVVSYGVRRRTREIGIRMALGARAADVTRLVTRQGMLPVAAGLALGVVAALLLSRLLASMVWGIPTTHPTTFAAVTVLLAAVGLLASWLPARRAARAEPMRALRQE